jgi:hypothetical protein
MMMHGTAAAGRVPDPFSLPVQRSGCTKGGFAAKQSGDTVSISRPAAALAKSGILDNLFGFEPAVPGRYTLDEIESHAHRFLSAFDSDFRSLLREKDISLNAPIELGHASDGSVIVKNSHPDKEAIEAIFAEHPDLRNEYTKITSMLGLAQHAQEAAPLHQAYRTNPRDAVARHAYLFTMNIETGLRISDDGPEVVHRRQTSQSG